MRLHVTLPSPVLQLPLGRLRAPPRRLRDRMGPKRGLHRTITALRSLLAALMGPMHILRWGPALACGLPSCLLHTGELGRA
jgi:hypothetical protein